MYIRPSAQLMLQLGTSLVMAALLGAGSFLTTTPSRTMSSNVVMSTL